MKSKKTILFFLLIPFFVKAQLELNKEKCNSYGMDYYSMNHQLTKYEFSFTGSFNPDYVSLHTNASVDFSVWYKREFKIDSSFNRLFLRANLMTSYKFGDIQINSTTEARVYEEFFEAPILFGLKMAAGKAAVINLAFGINYSVLSKQEYFALPGEILPPEYQKVYKFGSYSKLGFAAEISSNFYVSKKIFFDFGIWSDFDFNSPLTKSDNIPLTTVYRSFGTFVGLGRTF